MSQTTTLIFESPYFLRASSEAIDAWLSTGLRTPSAHVNSIGQRERWLLQAWKTLSERNPKTAGFSVTEIAQVMLEEDASASLDIDYLKHAVKVLIARWAHCGVVWRESAAGNKQLPFKTERGMVYQLRSHNEVKEDWRGGRQDTQDNQTLWRKDRKTGLRKAPKAVEKERDQIEATYRLVTDYVQPKDLSMGAGASYPLTLALVAQLVERCVRSTVRQDADSVESTIVLAGENIKTTAGRVYNHWEKGLDYGIMTADDAQLLLIILMKAASSIEQDLVAGRQPANRQFLDLKPITQLVMGEDADRSAYQALQKGMARILNTVFSFDLNREGELAKRLTGATGNKANSRVRFQLLENPAEGRHLGESSASVESEEWLPTTGMRYFTFSLHPLLWRGLIEGQGLGVHPQLIKERSGLLHKVYYHLRYHATYDNSYIVTTEQLMHRTHMVMGKNVARSRVEFARQLWQGIRRRALQTSLIDLPDVPTEPVVVQFYDLNLRIQASNIHKDALVIEARHSHETLEILRQNEARMTRIRELAALTLPDTYSPLLLR